MRVSRRSVLAAIPLMGCAGEADARVNVIHVTPTGEGDGSSWENAAAFDAIEDLIEHLQPGGEVLIAADRGEYAIAGVIEIARGGRASQEVHIRGVSAATGAPMLALVRGDQAGDEGPEVFKLLRGASHMKFSHFDFRDIGNGAFRVAGAVSNLTIEDCAFENIYRFFENTAGDGEGHASIDGFVLRRCRGSRVERGFLRIRYNSRNGLIEDCAAQGTTNDGGRIPVGCALDDRASDITYRRVVMGELPAAERRRVLERRRLLRRAGQFRYPLRGLRGAGLNRRGLRLQEPGRGARPIASPKTTSATSASGAITRDADQLHQPRAQLPRPRRQRKRQPVSRLDRRRREHRYRHRQPDHFEDRDATPIIEFNHDVGVVRIRGVTINSPRVNWGNDEGRIRARMLVGEPVFHAVTWLTTEPGSASARSSSAAGEKHCLRSRR
jgi:hypothetical protein